MYIYITIYIYILYICKGRRNNTTCIFTFYVLLISLEQAGPLLQVLHHFLASKSLL